MQASTPNSSRTAQSLVAALIFAAGITSVYAAESMAPAAPSKAQCEQQAKSQGLTGEKEKAFVDQCMHGG